MNHPRNLIELLGVRAGQQLQVPAYTFLMNGEQPETEWTYTELDRQARRIGAILQQHNAAGERVLLLYPPGPEFIAAFLGCLYAGAIAVPAYPPRNKRHIPRIQTIIDDAQARFLLTVKKSRERTETWLNVHSPGKSMSIISTDGLMAGLEDSWHSPDITGRDLAFLQYTSGSTALPKGVMVSHDNIWHNLKLIQECFEQTSQSVGVIWLPPYHDMGLIGGILQPLFVGFPVVLMSPTAFLQRPIRWLQAISRFKATTSGGPNFAYDLCVEKTSLDDRNNLDLRSWDVAFSGAEPVNPETLKRFSDTFRDCGFQEHAFFPCYGLAEATLLVSGGRKNEPPIVRNFPGNEPQQTVTPGTSLHGTKGGRVLVGCGRKLPRQEIRIVDPTSCVPCSPGQEGEIWLAGPCITQGYWDRPNVTQEHFQAYVSGDGDGPFFRTGDLGLLDDGELFVTGRLKDLIVIRGRNHYPQDLERCVERCDAAIRQHSVAAFSVPEGGEEKLVIVAEVERRFKDRRQKSSHAVSDPSERRDGKERRQSSYPDSEEGLLGFTSKIEEAFEPERIITNIRQTIAEEQELQVYAVVLLKFGTIPRTSSGKIQRHACKNGFLDGTLEVRACNTWEQSHEPQAELSLDKEVLLQLPLEERKVALSTHVQQLVANIIKCSPSQIQPTQSFSSLGLDSLQALELQYQLETLLDVEVPMTTFLQDVSFDEFARTYTEFLPSHLNATPGIPAIDEELDESPLSFNQKALWFLYQLAPESAAYHVFFAVRIHSELNIEVFRQAFQSIIDRHPSLRTTYLSRDGKPVQRIESHAHLALDSVDASGWEEVTLQEYLVSEAHRPFDLEQGPVLRMNLLKRAEAEHILLLTVHHIAIDMWSLLIIMDEFRQLYPALEAGTQIQLPSLRWSYIQYTQWQHALMQGPMSQKHWGYWHQQLSGELPALALPTDFPRPPIQTYRGASHEFTLSPEMTAKMKQMTKSLGGTLFTFLLASFQVLLHRYSGQDELLVGSPTTGRNKAQCEGVVGYFVNPVALRAKFYEDPTFQTFFHQVRQTVLEALEHQEYPFQLLVEHLHPKRDASRSPIFQAMFVLQRPHRLETLAPFVLKEEGARIELGNLRFESFKMEHQTAPFDLELAMIESEDKLSGSFQYNTALFRPETIRRMTGHFLTLLDSIVAHPEQRVSELSLLAEAERRQLLVDWNTTEVAYPFASCVHHLVEEQAERTPDAIALRFDRELLTYYELNCRANQLAHYLQKQGVKPESLVGVFVERSPEMVIGLLGILKAGGAYVPLDPMYPKDRVLFMLEDAQAQVLLTQRSLVETLELNGIHAVCLDSDWDVISQESDEKNPEIEVQPENLAYVIYTSGSTGKPKGVQIPHRALVNFLLSMQRSPGLTERDVLLAVTTISFDIAGLELYLPLITGACVVLASKEEASDGQLLLKKLDDSHATIMQATPVSWRLLLAAGWTGEPSIKVLCGGEAFPLDLAHQLAVRSHSVWNMYGPTETTIWSTTCKIEREVGTIAIGRPIANTQLYILDSRQEPVPIGVLGELYIGGDGLARGYLHRPDLDVERFVPDPFISESGRKLYRTGDVARYLPDGTIELLGRIDHQVKIRGFRIELGEIETVLAQHKAIRETTVVARTDRTGDKRLVAYWTPAQRPAPSSKELRTHLLQHLPDYMVPALFVELESFPLTPNGKIDRRALPEPNSLKVEDEYVAPHTTIEKILVDIWEEVLGVKPIGIQSNFFEIGGHSLLATIVLARIQQEFEVQLPLTILFEKPDISSLAEVINAEQLEGIAPDMLERMLTETEGLSDEDVLRLLDE